MIFALSITSIYQRYYHKSLLKMNSTILLCYKDFKQYHGKQYFRKENDLSHKSLLLLPSYKSTMINKADFLSLESKEMEEYTSNVDNSNNLFKKILISQDCSHQKVSTSFLQILRNLETCQFRISEDWSSPSINEMTDKMVNLIAQNKLDDSLIFRVLLRSILISPSNQSEAYTKFFKVYQELQNYCCIHIDKWSIDQILLLADMWYHVNFNKIYNWKVLETLEKKLEFMEPYQVVQFFFYLNVERRFKPQKDIENIVFKIVKNVSIDEIGVICLAFYKSQTIIKNTYLFKCIYNKVLDEINSASVIALGSILKFLRLNLSKFDPMHRKLCDQFIKQINESHIEIFKDNPSIILPLLSMANKINVYNEQLIINLVPMLNKNLSKLRIKDLEGLTFLLFNCRITSPNIADLLVSISNEINSENRNEEIETYPHAFLTCVLHITSLEHYSSSMISRALKLNYFTNTADIDKVSLQRFGHHHRSFHLMQLEGISSLENFDNQIYSIPKSYIDNLRKQKVPRIPTNNLFHLTRNERNLLLMQQLMKALGFENNQLVCSCVLPFLPHLSLVFCTDAEGNIVNLDSDFLKYKPEDVKFPTGKDSSNVIWNNVFIATKKFYLYNTELFRGEIQLVLSKSRKLGYQTSVISHTVLSNETNQVKLQSLCTELKQSSLRTSLLDEFSE